MKRILFSILFFSVLLRLEAQRLDLDKSWFNYSYRVLPNIVLDKSYMTFSVHITKTVALDAYSNESANNLINIEGKKKVSSDEYFDVNVNLGDLIIEQSEVKERIEVNKDKDGKEIGRNYYYHVEVKYSFDASAQVKDYKGKLLMNYGMAGRDTKPVFSSSEFGKYDDAANYYNNNKLEIKTSLVSEQINKALNSLNSSLNQDFGYRVINSREYFWNLGSPKHPEYKAYQEACAIGNKALTMITANEIPAQAKEVAQQAIDYFSGIVDKYKNAEEKAEKKLRYGAYFNLAEIFLFTEQFDKAKEYAQKLIDNDYDSRDGEKMIKIANSLQGEFEKHQINTQHFLPDTENIQPRP